MLLLQQMMVLFLYMLIGYFACKKGKFKEETGAQISWLVVNVANPMMILSSVVNGEGGIREKELLLTLGIAVGMFAVLILLAQMVPRVFRLGEKDCGVLKLMTVFNNIGFMGFPVISAIYGSSALLYAAIFLLPYNLLFYTYGVRMVCGKGETQENFQWSKILNIGVLACILAVFLYLTKLPVPAFFKSVTQGLSNLTAPLSMIVIGISLTKIPLKEIFMDKKLLLFSGIKLLLIPILGTFLLKQMVANEMLSGVCMIMLATPVGSMTAMLAQEKGGNYEMVAKGVALTTILSVATIPLVSAILF